MTERLYENNAYLKEFTGRILSCTGEKRGYAVILDRTAFYPEGGGQPWDLGTLGEARVLEVHRRGEDIVHLCDHPLTGEVTGRIDWPRRFDLMQQHSGEHLVSGLVHRFFGWDNVGFHMGADVITIDFNGPLTQEDLARVELAANEAVWADLETRLRYPAREELPDISYRSKKELTGQVRLVEFPGVDLCACCGTHVARTGEIGPIKLLSCVTFRQGVRVELVCGRRAYDRLVCTDGQNREISTLLSAKPTATAEAARRMAKELADTKYALAGLRRRDFARIAQELRGQGDVVRFEEGLTPEELRELCLAIMETCGGRCAVFSPTDQGCRYALGEQGGDLRAFTAELNRALNGRGGGKPNFTQGAVAADRRQVEAFLESIG